MPQFVLDHGTPKAAIEFNRLDPFTRGYIEAMFFTETGTGDDAEAGLEYANVAELALETVEIIKNDCAAFQRTASALLERAYGALTSRTYEPIQAGRDFWFTRNGHGVGFWDRGLGEIGEALSAECGFGTQFSETNLYRGDDGQLYLE